MTDVRIRKFRRHYRLPADALGERPRIDRAFISALGESLFDAALERAGLSAMDEVCIRRVKAVVRLHTGGDDLKLAVACSVALVDAIVAELAGGGANVVRFPSRQQALLDMALSVARGHLERAWAWKQLSLWLDSALDSLRDAEREVVGAFARNPKDAPHVLAQVAHAGLLGPYLRNVPDSYWSTFTAALFVEFDQPPGHQNTLSVASVAEPAMAEGAAHMQWLDRAVGRIWKRSRILRNALLSARSMSSTKAQAIAIAAIAELEPSSIGAASVDELVRGIAHKLTDEQLVKRTTQDQVHPTPSLTDEPADTRVRLHTSYGGLLFLLHAVRELDIPYIVANDVPLQGHSLRWVLHELAKILVRQALEREGDHTTSLNDAALFAFAGVVAGRGTDGISHGASAAQELAGEGEATAPQLVSLANLAAAMLNYVRERGGALPAESNAGLLRRILVREAEIRADAAWIDVHFSINDTSTDIRRAGLDLDLGWLPWLGVVMRFVYA